MTKKIVKVRVPATTANLGAGFDTFGLALTLYNEFEVEEADDVFIESYPENEFLKNPENNLFIKVVKYLCEAEGKTFHGAKLKQTVNIPVARGLGSSATAIVAGILTGFAVHKKPLTDEEFFKVAYLFEPHPDNLLPAWKGGFITALKTEDKTYYSKIDFPQELKAVVVIPDFELSTELARSVLPKEIPLKDAVFNIQRASLFIRALQEKRFDLLKVAMEDRLHQPYRKSLIPNFDKVIQYAYDSGAVGASLSGAGSTMLALALDNFDKIGQAMVSAFSEAGINAKYLVLDVDTEGAKVEIVEK
ncbi:MAG TPA: homoserine kinase [Sulfurihydrogenibium sp.]|uniref:homoserine kinase n=1 Tax=Sulfurihydrogenibium sp. (strain YO3AOP1) TaxID=436114 RepID=UPI0001722FAC|nr:homoserine kinase [Sulfurihydrogenibium sp. YO3AOP1]ACD66683.1 homoserine kinase [Sulfurihydrogenibium sp. YO3AOP1]HBT98288.1 homoserine kinase [Sulfurihydrogenibium sp.]